MTKELYERVSVKLLEEMFLFVCSDCGLWYNRFVGAVWYAEGCGLISPWDSLWLLRAAGELYASKGASASFTPIDGRE